MSHRRDQRASQGSDQAPPSHAQPSATSSPSTAEELTKLAGLHDHGVLTDTEYNNQKAKLLA